MRQPNPSEICNTRPKTVFRSVSLICKIAFCQVISVISYGKQFTNLPKDAIIIIGVSARGSFRLFSALEKECYP